uniref:Uncharacterized protein n=1 Tax=Nelumbo nucifera TaxID=4432 RepID=A0A822YMW1_NELNU|nr:TPA_asm: hypothetical protein HUJ06_006154 [Nelumbo nucifera]
MQLLKYANHKPIQILPSMKQGCGIHNSAALSNRQEPPLDFKEAQPQCSLTYLLQIPSKPNQLSQTIP